MRTLIAALAATVLLGTSAASAQPAPPPDSVAEAAVQAASDTLAIPPENLMIAASEQRNWPDSSLGCPEPGRAYSQIVTPGYFLSVVTEDGENEALVHTDLTGQRAVVCDDSDL